MANAFHEACIAGTMDWFAAMLDLYPTPDDSVRIPPRDRVTAVFAFGTAQPGAMALEIPRSTVPLLISRHTGEDPAAFVTQDYADLLKLKGILVTNLRTQLESRAGATVSAGPPWILQGDAAALAFPNGAVMRESGFASEFGGFVVRTADTSAVTFNA